MRRALQFLSCVVGILGQLPLNSSSERSVVNNSSPAASSAVDGIPCDDCPAACETMTHVERTRAELAAHVESFATPSEVNATLDLLAASRGKIAHALRDLLRALSRPAGELEDQILWRELDSLERQEKSHIKLSAKAYLREFRVSLDRKARETNAVMDKLDVDVHEVGLMLWSTYPNSSETPELIESLESNATSYRKALHKLLKRTRKRAQKRVKKQVKRALKAARKKLTAEYNTYREGETTVQPPGSLAAQPPSWQTMSLLVAGVVSAVIATRMTSTRTGTSAEPLLA